MKYALYAFLFYTLFSCSPSAETKFEKKGIGLVCPSGWKITEEDSLENEGYYMSLEKDGVASSGLCTVTWVQDSIDLGGWLEGIEEEFKSNVVYKNSDLVFDLPKDNTYNNLNSLSATFTAQVLGVKHEGIIHLFYLNGKTVFVLRQEAEEDKKDNEAGFKTIEASLRGL